MTAFILVDNVYKYKFTTKDPCGEKVKTCTNQ